MAPYVLPLESRSNGGSEHWFLTLPDLKKLVSHNSNGSISLTFQYAKLDVPQVGSIWEASTSEKRSFPTDMRIDSIDRNNLSADMSSGNLVRN